MCGIAGMWNYKSGRPVDRDQLTAITRALAHRGPDGEGYYWGPGAGLGHRRLSIIDLEGGHQPMSNEDGSIWIIFNGEIYNYPELREQLLARGHVFKTHSDTEAIVHLYEDHAEGCFEKLRGMFALAIWDTRQKKLVLARDRLGIKPMFYGLGEEGIVFGSELKCIRLSGQVDLEIEPTAIADLFTFFYIPGPKTVYRDVYQLEPGHSLTVTASGVSKRKYWDLQEGELHLASEKQYEDRLYEILHDSVRCHLLSDVPLGAFLSGGVDSSAVVALMSTLVPDPVMTCSIGFDVAEYDELPRARTVAQLFHTDHHERVVTPDPAKVLEELVNHYDEPFPDHSAIPTYYVSKLARERVKVVLSGDGGDENFAGYSRYRRHMVLEKIRNAVPAPIRVPLLSPFRISKGNRQNGTLPSRLHRVAHQVAVGPREGYIHALTIADSALRQRIFSPDLQQELRGYDPLDVFREIYDRAPSRDAIARMSYLDLKTYLVDDILTKVDRASMANSLEVRVPLLDHKVVEFGFSLPAKYKLRDGQGKYLLRQAMKRHLPAAHLGLQKKGFRIPMVPWVRGELRAWTQNAIFANNDAMSFLDRAGVQQVWDSFQNGGEHLADVLSIVLSFSLSTRAWMQARPNISQAAAVER